MRLEWITLRASKFDLLDARCQRTEEIVLFLMLGEYVQSCKVWGMMWREKPRSFRCDEIEISSTYANAPHDLTPLS